MPEACVVQDLSESNIIFIHSSLDDVGLNPSEFRVYAHLSRRAGTKDKAWPGVDSIAKVCKIHKETAIAAIRELEVRNMVLADRRPGKTTIYRLTPPSSWVVVGNGERSEMGNGVVGNGELTSMEMGNERVSNEGNPEKDIQPTEKPETDFYDLSVGEGFSMFWDEYPRHEARLPAARAYRKNHKHLPEMLEALRQFKTTDQWNKGVQFIPHAATWLNERRWEDEIPKPIQTKKKDTMFLSR